MDNEKVKRQVERMLKELNAVWWNPIFGRDVVGQARTVIWEELYALIMNEQAEIANADGNSPEQTRSEDTEDAEDPSWIVDDDEEVDDDPEDETDDEEDSEEFEDQEAAE